MSRTYTQLDMEPLYGFSHRMLMAIYGLCFRGEISGQENLPAEGGYLVACNHTSMLDPPIVGLFLRQQVVFFARKTLWKPGIVTFWLDGVSTIPVDRDGGTDVAAFKRVLNALKQNRVIILFPEGTRSPDGNLQKPKPGIGLIACRAQVPIVPARIFGAAKAFGRGGRVRLGTPVSVTYGKPLSPADYDDPRDGKQRYQRTAERIMAAIARLQLPPETVI